MDWVHVANAGFLALWTVCHFLRAACRHLGIKGKR